MKKVLFIIVCLFLSACVRTVDFGVNVKGENIKKTTCHAGGYPNLFYSKESCLKKAKEICSDMKISATYSGGDSHGYFHEILYVCETSNKENN